MRSFRLDQPRSHQRGLPSDHRSGNRYRPSFLVGDFKLIRLWDHPGWLGFEQQIQFVWCHPFLRQFISYEIPLGLSLIGVIAIAGSLNIERIVEAQGTGIANWNIWWQPLAAVIFFTAALAETNRLPFDLPECEQELVGGFHTEYSGIKFVLFFLAEYTHVVTISFLTVLLFFGGWHFPGLTGDMNASLGGYALRWTVLLVKVAMVIGLIMQLRWTLPRFRFDQLMSVAWKGLIPMGVCNLMGLVVVLTLDLSRWWLAILSFVILGFAGALNVAFTNARINNRLTAGARSTSYTETAQEGT